VYHVQRALLILTLDFSGFYSPAGILGDLWRFESESMTWSELFIAGPPSHRLGHGLVAVRSLLYLHGGLSDAGLAYHLFAFL
jgi:hypothetical protein